MTKFFENDVGALHQGDVMNVLKSLPKQSVQCCVTSPPYYGLRDYGMDGQIGLESTPELFVEHLVKVFCEVRRVLRDDGTLWLNLGDSYNSTNGFVRNKGSWHRKGRSGGSDDKKAIIHNEIKIKDLMMMPARVALALQADGWWIRSDIAWCKKTPMPESVTDRPTSAWEHIFLLSKSKSYYYDSEAVKVTKEQDPKNAGVDGTANDTPWNNNPNGHMGTSSTGANMRNFWVLGPEQFPDAHFATFPTEIPRRAIKAGTRVGDTVLDPFMGSGTTAQVAQNLNRRWVGIELNPEYCDIAVKRIQNRAAQRMLV
jgi:DNA modification methylase